MNYFSTKNYFSTNFSTILILVVLFWILSYVPKIEYFNEGTLEQNDPVFANAKFYLLDLNTTDEITGFSKCIKECQGVCVEYGITGSAWCIPNGDDVPPPENDGVPRSIPSTTF